MLFEANLLFSLPTTIGASAVILAPFLNLLLLASLIALLYLIFQTNVGRNILGLIGGATLLNLFFTSHDERYHSHGNRILVDSQPSGGFFNPPPTTPFRNPSSFHGHSSRQNNTPSSFHGHSSRQDNTPSFFHEHTSRQDNTPSFFHGHTSRQDNTPSFFHGHQSRQDNNQPGSFRLHGRS